MGYANDNNVLCFVDLAIDKKITEEKVKKVANKRDEAFPSQGAVSKQLYGFMEQRTHHKLLCAYRTNVAGNSNNTRVRANEHSPWQLEDTFDRYVRNTQGFHAKARSTFSVLLGINP